MASRILVVEDDNIINDMIHEAMERAGYECLQAFSGTEGILLVKTEKVDLVILDLMLPGKRGEDVIKEIKAIKNIPVIIVSAKDGIDSKVELLKNGADDYLTKPFDIKELEVRVEVRLRRYRESIGAETVSGSAENNRTESKSESSKDKQTTIAYKELELNTDSFQVTVNKNPIDLTKHEFRILELLMKNPNRAFSKQAIYDFAWDDLYLGEDKTINVHISNIRKKIKVYTETEYIETVWGIGFKLKTK